MSDADLALLALAAEHAFATASSDLHPAFDTRYGAWLVEGWITGTDTAFTLGRFRALQYEVFYGWLLRQGNHYAIAIRGTGDPIEWWIDTLWMPRQAHPCAGRVESGFWSVYQSLKLDGQPISALAKRTEMGTLTIVVGHSLGAAVATYLTLDLAKELGHNAVRGLFIASPHPGDSVFSQAFGDAAPQHVMYQNIRDVVPRVPLSIPFILNYSSVPHVHKLSAVQQGITVTGGLAKQHRIFTYFALMAPDRLPELRQRFGATVSYLH